MMPWAPREIAPTIFVAFVLAVLAYQFPITATLDIGSGRDAPFVRGFSFRENYDGGSFRWSSRVAEIRFWGVGAQTGALVLKLAMSEQNRAAGIQIWANQRLLGTLTPAPGFTEFNFTPISREDIGWSGDLVVTLVSNSVFTAPPDTRTLGVQVDYARFHASGTPVVPALRALVFLPALALLAFGIARVWSNRPRIAHLAGITVAILGALGLIVARVETAYFLAPLFAAGLALFVGALVLARALQGLSRDVFAERLYADASLKIRPPTRRADAHTRLNGQYARRRVAADRRPPIFMRPSECLDARTIRLLFVVMLAAFVVRMYFAVGPGYIVDTQDYVVWSYKTVTRGLGTAFVTVEGLWEADNPPGLIYVFHLMGLVYQNIFAPDFLYPAEAGDPSLRSVTTNPALLADPIQRTLLRLPQLFADLITGALIFAAAHRFVSLRSAWLVTLAYWFHPIVIWNSAYWGQVDAIHSLFVLSAFLLLVVRRADWAFLLAGMAALTKPQGAIFGLLLLLGAWRVGRRKGVGRAIAFGLAGVGLMLAPIVWAGGAVGMIDHFMNTIGHHPVVTANAHNLWWLVFGGDTTVVDERALFPGAPLSIRTFSVLLFAAFYLLALARAWRAPLEDFLDLGAFIAFAFFVVVTEIHENYGFALLPLLAVAMTRDRILIGLYAAIGATMVLNYALFDPPLLAWLGIRDSVRELAAWHGANSWANLLLLGGWTVYLLARRSVTEA